MWTNKTYLNLFLLFLCFKLSSQIACRSERNSDVDWYLNYKIPKIDSEPLGSDLGKGTAYAYITPPGSSWKLSTKNILSGSMLEKTMNNFYAKKETLTYLLYNDDAPGNMTKTAPGHMKGVLAFDGNTGFWLIHSIPNFADPKSYKYPNNAKLNGQSILCVTFRTSELNEISHQLLLSHPNIYDYYGTDEVIEQLDDKAKTLFTDRPVFVRKPPLTRVTDLKSLGNMAFVSYAKDNQYKKDLYSDIIAPDLESSLMAETWRRGSGKFLPPSCNSSYYVLDIVSINMTLNSRRNRKNISFKSTSDHSKWAISDDKKNWICICDINRMASQEHRGGGALCFTSKPIRNAYYSIIEDTDTCPRDKK